MSTVEVKRIVVKPVGGSLALGQYSALQDCRTEAAAAAVSASQAVTAKNSSLSAQAAAESSAQTAADDAVAAASVELAGYQSACSTSATNAHTSELNAHNSELAAAASASSISAGVTTALPKPAFMWNPAMAPIVHPLATFTRATTGTYVDSSGIIRSAAINAPRYDCDPLTGECKGVLIEGGSQNLLTYSEKFDNAAWTKTRATVTANAAVAPDGTTTMDKLVEDSTASNTHLSGQSFSAVSGTTYCYSIFVKASERSILVLLFPLSQFGTTQSVLFNLNTVTGAIASGNPQYGIVSYGNGYYRVWISAAATSSAASTVYAYLADNSGNATYSGNGSSGLYIWGAQLEASASPSSYIPTTTAAASRSADVATVALSSLVGPHGEALWNGVEGTLVVRGSTVLPNSSYTCLATLDDGTGNNTVRMRALPGGLDAFVNAANVTQFDVADQPYTSYAKTALAIALKASDFAFCKDGASVIAAATGSIPTVTKLSVGSLAGVANYLNGHIRQVTLYNRRLTNTQLQQLTA